MSQPLSFSGFLGRTQRHLIRISCTRSCFSLTGLKNIAERFIIIFFLAKRGIISFPLRAKSLRQAGIISEKGRKHLGSVAVLQKKDLAVCEFVCSVSMYLCVACTCPFLGSERVLMELFQPVPIDTAATETELLSSPATLLPHAFWQLHGEQGWRGALVKNVAGLHVQLSEFVFIRRCGSRVYAW